MDIQAYLRDIPDENWESTSLYPLHEYSWWRRFTENAILFKLDPLPNGSCEKTVGEIFYSTSRYATQLALGYANEVGIIIFNTDTSKYMDTNLCRAYLYFLLGANCVPEHIRFVFGIHSMYCTQELIDTLINSGATILYNEANIGGYAGVLRTGTLSQDKRNTTFINFTGKNNYYDTYAHNRAYEKQTHSIAMELSKLSLSHNVTIEQVENSIDDYRMLATQLSCGNHDFTFIERIPMEDWREHYFYKSLVHTPDDDFRYINYDMRLLHDYVKIWQYVFHCVGFSFRDRFLDSKDILARIPMFAEVFSVDTLVRAYSDGVPLEDLCVSD